MTEPIEPREARRLDDRDLSALIGVAVVLEVALLGDEVDPDLANGLLKRFRAAGLLDADDGIAQLRVAVLNLNHRLRYVLGETDRPPTPSPGHTDQLLGFPTEDAAAAFLERARALGEQGSGPLPVDGRAYDGPVNWEVTINTTDLRLTPSFGDHQRALVALAGEHQGRHGGSAG